MILSKSRVAPPPPERGGAGGAGGGTGRAAAPALPDLEDFLARRDYVGAIALLQFRRRSKRGDVRTAEWLAYCHFHYGEHDKALQLYADLLAAEDPDPLHYVYGAACHYYMGSYAEAEAMAGQGPRCPLQTRILFHCAHKRGDEGRLMQYHQQLGSATEDQLSLAAVHFQRANYQARAPARPYAGCLRRGCSEGPPLSAPHVC